MLEVCEMKIITDDVNKMIICGGCNCVYLYDDADLHLIPPMYLGVSCPKCGQQVMLLQDVKLKESRIIEVSENENN